MEQVPPRPGSWWLMTPDDDEFAKWGHSFSSSHGRGLLQRMQSADLPDKTRTTLKWNKKSLQFRTLTPHLEVPSAQRLTVCTAVSLAWCPRPSRLPPPHCPGPVEPRPALRSSSVASWQPRSEHVNTGTDTSHRQHYTPTSSSTLHCSIAKHCPCLHENVVT